MATTEKKREIDIELALYVYNVPVNDLIRLAEKYGLKVISDKDGDLKWVRYKPEYTDLEITYFT